MATWQSAGTHHGGSDWEGVYACLALLGSWTPRFRVRAGAKPYLKVMYSYQPPRPSARAKLGSQPSPNRKSRQEQDGELVVLPDLLILVLNVFAAVRVSTSKSTTSRRATVRPPRARTRTCFCWSRYALNTIFVDSVLRLQTSALPFPRPAHGRPVQQGRFQCV